MSWFPLSHKHVIPAAARRSAHCASGPRLSTSRALPISSPTALWGLYYHHPLHVNEDTATDGLSYLSKIPQLENERPDSRCWALLTRMGHSDPDLWGHERQRAKNPSLGVRDPGSWVRLGSAWIDQVVWGKSLPLSEPWVSSHTEWKGWVRRATEVTLAWILAWRGYCHVPSGGHWETSTISHPR